MGLIFTYFFDHKNTLLYRSYFLSFWINHFFAAIMWLLFLHIFRSQKYVPISVSFSHLLDFFFKTMTRGSNFLVISLRGEKKPFTYWCCGVRVHVIHYLKKSAQTITIQHPFCDSAWCVKSIIIALPCTGTTCRYFTLYKTC